MIQMLKNVVISIKDGDWIETKDQSKSGIRLIQTGNIGEDEFLDKSEKARFISDDTYNKLKCTCVEAGDLLISRLPDPLGRCCEVPLSDVKFIASVDCSIIKLNENIVSKRYFINYTKSNSYHIQVESFSSGATRKRISRKNLENIKIKLYDLPIQNKISEILDSIQNIIKLKKEQISSLKELQDNKFIEMFGNVNINERNWEERKLRDCCYFYNGKAHEKIFKDNGKFTIVNAKFISSNGDIIKQTDEQLFPLFKGDIAMVMSDLPNGKTLAKCFLIDADKKYTLNQRVCALRTNKLNNIFLYKTLNRNEYFLNFDDGNGQTNLRKDDILNCKIMFPPIELQNLYSNFYIEIESKIKILNESILDLELLHETKMHEYFD